MVKRIAGRRRILALIALAGICSFTAAIFLVGLARAGSSRKELLQSKRGSEYVVAMARLRLRDPLRDARDDLLGGDKNLYCVGTYGCWPAGLEGSIPSQVSIHATATTGCVITGGALEMAYRREEERYVAAYNRAKLIAIQSGVPAAGRGDEAGASNGASQLNAVSGGR